MNDEGLLDQGVATDATLWIYKLHVFQLSMHSKNRVSCLARYRMGNQWTTRGNKEGGANDKAA